VTTAFAEEKGNLFHPVIEDSFGQSVQVSFTGATERTYQKAGQSTQGVSILNLLVNFLSLRGRVHFAQQNAVVKQ
jgi:hypothetical protein